MSIQSTLDLRATASPRSLCVFAASETEQGSTTTLGKPLDINHPPVDRHAMAVVAGTERGTLHFRTFSPPSNRSTMRGGLSSSASTAVTSSSAPLSSSSSGKVQSQAPLGLGGGGAVSGARGSSSATANLPREYYPVDLTSLPGAVAACIKLSPSKNAFHFLLLLDDNRGNKSSAATTVASSSAASLGTSATAAGISSHAGHYSAMLVTLAAGHFHVTPASNNFLPRISCAIHHPTIGLVYATGRSIVSVGPDAWHEEVVVVKRGTRYGSTSSGSIMSSNSNSNMAAGANSAHHHRSWKRLVFGTNILPTPGVRSGQDAIALTAGGRVAVVAVGNSFYAVAGQEVDEDQLSPAGESNHHAMSPSSANTDCVKILSFTQSSQVHPVIVLDMYSNSQSSSTTNDPDWSCLFLASGRECAIVDLYYGPTGALTPSIGANMKPRHTVSVASPILAAATSSTAFIVVLTSDGLISVRSPLCLAISLRTVEVGQRPNDFFVLRTLHDDTQPGTAPWIVALAFSGESKVLQCQPDTAQDLADRLIRHAIDAFGANGFPRSELAEAVNASFTATSYVGPEASPQARNLLKQYLEAVLGLADFDGGGSSSSSAGWPTELADATHHGTFAEAAAAHNHAGARSNDAFSSRGTAPAMLSSASPSHLMCATAMLCLACSQLSPPLSSLACRAAKACAEKMGVVFDQDVPHSAAQVCELIAEKLLREASSKFSLLSGSSPTPITHRSQSALFSDFCEASIWLLRSAGRHERAIEVAHDRLLHQALTDSGSTAASGGRGSWSRIKYESYTATHLSEIWSSGKEEGYSLVLHSPASFRLLENNPRLGLSVFTASHPQNESQWRSMLARDDPLAQPKYAYEVLKLLKSINPALPYDKEKVPTALSDSSPDGVLPLESGRALSVSFLESAIGIATGRPTEQDEFDSLPADEAFEQHLANFHDELSFLLLEGVIAERRDDSSEEEDTPLGQIYRHKLRQLLRWPLAKVRPERFMETLPSSFLQEKALILGRVGRHEDALRILYRDLNSLDLALEYCDNRYERQKVQQEDGRRGIQQQQWSGGNDSVDTSGPNQSAGGEDNAYLPLVRVALDSEDTERGITAAIQVLALRRGAIDRAAALRLLPSGVPVSAVARPFLIPALVDSESQVRRLTVVSALFRARYLRLKQELTVAQLKAQANIHVVSQFRNLDLGDLVQSSKAFRVRTSTAASSTMPDLMVIKHFFPKHLVIQAKVTNTTGQQQPLLAGTATDFGLGSTGAGVSSNQMGRILSDIAFVVAESSEEAIQPLMQVPIHVLPVQMTGCAWCVLDADPAHMDGATAQLTCELRYTVQPADFSAAGSSRAAMTRGGGILSSPASASLGRIFVEELQDLEVHAAHFF